MAVEGVQRRGIKRGVEEEKEKGGGAGVGICSVCSSCSSRLAASQTNPF